jgi:hypothetical protein
LWQDFFLSDNCGFLNVGPIRWVYNLFVQMLLGLSRVVTPWSESRRTQDHILLSHLRLQVPVFISLRNRVAQLYPLSTEFPFRCLLRLSGLWWRYSNQPSHRNNSLLKKLKLIYDRRSVSQYVLVWGSHLESTTRFFFLSDNCGFLDVGHPLWREDASVISYYCFWDLPRFRFRMQVSQNSLPYFSVSYETPLIWRARSPYLNPPGSRWPS